jgi:hypothetical protein
MPDPPTLVNKIVQTLDFIRVCAIRKLRDTLVAIRCAIEDSPGGGVISPSPARNRKAPGGKLVEAGTEKRD